MVLGKIGLVIEMLFFPSFELLSKVEQRNHTDKKVHSKLNWNLLEEESGVGCHKIGA